MISPLPDSNLKNSQFNNNRCDERDWSSCRRTVQQRVHFEDTESNTDVAESQGSDTIAGTGSTGSPFVKRIRRMHQSAMGETDPSSESIMPTSVPTPSPLRISMREGTSLPSMSTTCLPSAATSSKSMATMTHLSINGSSIGSSVRTLHGFREAIISMGQHMRASASAAVALPRATLTLSSKVLAGSDCSTTSTTAIATAPAGLPTEHHEMTPVRVGPSVKHGLEDEDDVDAALMPPPKYPPWRAVLTVPQSPTVQGCTGMDAMIEQPDHDQEGQVNDGVQYKDLREVGAKPSSALNSLPYMSSSTAFSTKAAFERIAILESELRGLID
ncbi:hypothetical protein BG004_005849 [Podila humilis]|nr:hypothetical protein BG004_005849 [Podila humilis]